MRITHLIQSAPEVYGAERCALLQLATLRRRGHEANVVVVCETRMGPGAEVLPRALEEAGVPVSRVWSRSQISVGLMRDLSATLRRLDPDVVHTHGLKADILGFLSTRLCRLPVLIEVHGWLRPDDDRRVRLYEALDRAALRRAEAALVLTGDYQRELRALGVPPGRTHLLPSGIDIEGLQAAPRARDLRAELGIPPKTPVAGIVARLSPEKGHVHFLRALRFARDGWTGPGPKPVGLILGDGPLREELIAGARDLIDEKAVHFLGYLPQIADGYRALDVLLSCSRYEGLPLCLIEAMALSRPVLSMATGGCADIVAHGETGWLVPRDDGEALARGLLRLCTEPALMRRMGEAGEARARARYSLDAWAQGAETIYRSIARRRG